LLMTTMIAEVYDALIAAGAPEDKARKAAEAVAGFETYEPRFVRIETSLSNLERNLADVARDVGDLVRRVTALERDNLLNRWMLGFILAFQVAFLVKVLLH
jgi:hypothetical protein